MRSNCRPWVVGLRVTIGIPVFALFALKGIGAAEPVEAMAEQEAPFVCAQVVLAIDSSESTRDDAFHRQIEAFRIAFDSGRLYHAVQDCLPGSVAFAVTTWSSAGEQDLTRPRGRAPRRGNDPSLTRRLIGRPGTSAEVRTAGEPSRWARNASGPG